MKRTLVGYLVINTIAGTSYAIYLNGTTGSDKITGGSEACVSSITVYN